MASVSHINALLAQAISCCVLFTDHRIIAASSIVIPWLIWVIKLPQQPGGGQFACVLSGGGPKGGGGGGGGAGGGGGGGGGGDPDDEDDPLDPLVDDLLDADDELLAI